MLTVLVVEDHVLVREGLLATVSKLAVDVHAISAGDVLQAIRVLEKYEVDLVLLDLMLPKTSGETLLPIIRSRFASVPVVVLSAKDDANTVADVMAAGASGFVSKASSGSELLQAIKSVRAGELYVTPSVRDAALKVAMRREIHTGKRDLAIALLGHEGLTPTQSRVLSLLCEGNSNGQIAVVLGIGAGTVKTHVSAIIKTMGVTTRAEAVAKLNRAAH